MKLILKPYFMPYNRKQTTDFGYTLQDIANYFNYTPLMMCKVFSIDMIELGKLERCELEQAYVFNDLLRKLCFKFVINGNFVLSIMQRYVRGNKFYKQQSNA